MNPTELLKDLRDALWQAEIDDDAVSDQVTADPYSIPLDEITGGLAARGILSDADAKLVIALLDHFDPDDGYSPVDTVPDSLATETARIVAQLRSVRGSE